MVFSTPVREDSEEVEQVDAKLILGILGGLAALFFLTRRSNASAMPSVIGGTEVSDFSISPQTGLPTNETGYILPFPGNQAISNDRFAIFRQSGVNSVTLTPDGHYDVIYYNPFYMGANEQVYQEPYKTPAGFQVIGNVPLGGGYEHISLAGVI